MLMAEFTSAGNHRGKALRLTVPPASARVLEIELSQPLPTITAVDDETQTRYKRVFCLIRFHTQPLGILLFPFQYDKLLPEDYAPLIWHTFNHAILQHLDKDSLSPVDEIPIKGLQYDDLPRCIAERERFLADSPFVSVIVPTHDRPESLAMCIDALVKLHYPHYEIIIVDNSPTTQATADLVQKTYQHVSNLRYIREDGQGSSRAKNLGIQEARGEILAFTDDDAVVDTYWLVQLVKAFEQSSEIVCVTGCTLPLELNTPAQLLYENISRIENGEVNDKFVPHFFDKKTRYKHLYRGDLWWGSGCGNMAAKADFLRSIGSFDVVLGPGTPAMAGEDLALFLHLIMHNKILAYEPTAVMHHLYRREYDELRKQIFAFGAGFIAYLIHVLLRYPVLCIDLFTRTPCDILLSLLGRISRKLSGEGQQRNVVRLKSVSRSTIYPGELVAIKLKGVFYGPIAYIKSVIKSKTSA